MKSKWKQVEGLKDILNFQRDKTIISEQVYGYGSDIPIPRHVSYPEATVITFSDGSQLACASAIEYTGFCDTCAGEEAWTGYFIKEAP